MIGKAGRFARHRLEFEMRMSSISMARWLVALLCTSGLVLLAGCNQGLKRVPVSGTVTLDGQPLDGGIIRFNPDESKGNTARVSCAGPLRSGRFEVRTSGVESSDDGPGAPRGWYRVTFAKAPGEKKPVPLAAIYTEVESTPLSVEVVEKPADGAYNFTLTR
jgi:hypothetical protein